MDIVQLITSVGFPVVACLAMGGYCKSIIDSYRKDIMDMVKDNWSKMADVTKSLDENTRAINELREYIKRGD